MKHFLFKLLVALAVISLLGAVGFLIGDYILTRERLPYNTYIGTVNVSLLTQNEATQKLREYTVDEAAAAPLVLYFKEKDFFLLPSVLGIAIDVDESVKKAFQKTHDKNYLRQLHRRLTKESVLFPLVLKADEQKLAGALKKIADKINRPARNASLVLEGKGLYTIIQHKVGRTLDEEKSLASIKEALANNEQLLPLVVQETAPRIKYEDLAEYPPAHLLSTYTTYYGTHDSPNRIHNIKLIANTLIDGTILLSGEAFSLLDAIGEISFARGFREAFVIVEGELEPQVGGGTCQTATTLYNTVMLADLEVLSRRNHSLFFYIYPLGRDATVYGATDFKFKNNTGHPIYLKGQGTNRSLTFKIYGTPTGKVVTFSSPSVVYRGEDGAYHTGWRAPKNVPFSTRVVRTVTKDGKEIKKEVIRSYYKLIGDGSNVVIRRPEPR